MSLKKKISLKNNNFIVPCRYSSHKSSAILSYYCFQMMVQLAVPGIFNVHIYVDACNSTS